MRITTNMIMRNYNNNLSSTMQGLESARRQVETGRRFMESYEDPTAAAKGAVLERRYARNADYQANVSNTQKWQDAQEDVVTQLSEMAKKVNKDYSANAMSDPTGEGGRDTYAKLFRGMQESMVQTLNAQYGNTFVMAGQEGSKPPFELKDGKVYYQGIDVNTDDPDELDKLKEMAQEASYVDLGFGMSLDANGEVVSSTAFNAALPGINVVGFGKENGMSKNIIVLAGQMADELEKPDFDKDAYGKLWDQFNKGGEKLQDSLTTIGTKSQLLDNTKTRLENEKLNIEKQFDEAINIEPAKAITNYSWANYAYNTALKVGTSIITPSLLDFMKM